MWLTRNDWVFKDKLMKSPLQVIYKCVSLIALLKEKRKGLLKEKDCSTLDDFQAKIMEALEALKPMLAFQMIWDSFLLRSCSWDGSLYLLLWFERVCPEG